ncbi:LrgB family protein [Paenibacillus antri]|uniref:LrgB family protein n=1 Tax=Paenibacillus antri TaxID=2582848 RepID=A0A5R9G7T3_9BACL|nr:LrgB family protein [Paenibacillus antri]TLS49488.1 LrgB family protein [Paenibacillus antri]
MTALREWASTPVFAVAVTVGLYVLSLRWNARRPWLHPLIVTSGGMMALLLAADIPYATYSEGGDLLSFFLGPATVALAVPLYKRRSEIRRRLGLILASVTVGSAAGIGSAWLLVALLGGSRDLLIASLPKSATSAISIELARYLGGPGELSAVLTVLTGIAGSMFGPALLRLFRIDGDVPLGLAVGTAAHGIGTSRLLRDSEEAGSYSGLAMGIAGIVISLLMVPLSWLL